MAAYRAMSLWPRAVAVATALQILLTLGLCVRDWVAPASSFSSSSLSPESVRVGVGVVLLLITALYAVALIAYLRRARFGWWTLLVLAVMSLFGLRSSSGWVLLEFVLPVLTLVGLLSRPGREWTQRAR